MTTVLTDDARARELREAMVTRLQADGALTDPAWAAAMRTVPRHLFVPRFFSPTGRRDGYTLTSGGDADYLRVVYADEPLVTQLDGDLDADHASAGTAYTGAPTCSSSQPSLMALMLAHLDVADRMRVLELGTGTGYNAALLSARLGDAGVTTVDIDPDLLGAARDRLAAAGYRPALAVTDGASGHPGGAPYDRLIATYGVPSISPAWIRQVTPGGLILANLATLLPSGALARLTVADDNTASGTFTDDYAGFMVSRVRRDPDALRLYEATDPGQLPVPRSTSVTASMIDEHDGLRLLAALTIPARQITIQPSGGPAEAWLLAADGSAARQTTGSDGTAVVSETGPRSLWTEAENLHRVWAGYGQPGRSQITLIVDSVGHHTIGIAGTPWSTLL
jgi:methyltransferase of ATP-grasp peptide maturase system